MLSESFVNSAVGLKTHGGIKYQTVAQNLTEYVKPGSDGINHGEWAELSFHLCGF